jgi:hypothetical protein
MCCLALPALKLPTPTANDLNDHHNWLSSAPLQDESNFGDSSWPLFAMYSNISDEEDNKVAERWQKDAEGTIIFVRSGPFP